MYSLIYVISAPIYGILGDGRQAFTIRMKLSSGKRWNNMAASQYIGGVKKTDCAVFVKRWKSNEVKFLGVPSHAYGVHSLVPSNP